MRQVAISIDFTRSRTLIDLSTAAARCLTRARTASLPVALAVFAFLCAGAPAGRAANFSCTWTDASDNWTTTGDWFGCNGAFPNNGGGNTFDATISTGDPTLTTAVNVGSVTINSLGAWTVTGAGASATLSGVSSNAGTLALANGASVTTVGVGLTNTGGVSVDGGFDAGGGGGALTLGGALTNSAGAVTNTGSVNVDNVFGGSGGSTVTVGGALDNDSGSLGIGNTALSAPATVTANGLSNTGGGISIIGTTNQASLKVAVAAPSTSLGNIQSAAAGRVPRPKSPAWHTRAR
jgi:hypothetical protein